MFKIYEIRCINCDRIIILPVVGDFYEVKARVAVLKKYLGVLREIQQKPHMRVSQVDELAAEVQSVLEGDE